jgi:serine/threonine protein kinase
MAGEYRLLRKLGEGGFGAVYEAEHPLLRRRAAVKVLHQAAGMDSDAVLRFISEAQAANHIRSRHIVDVFSFGKLPNGRHFYVMDMLDGDPLDRFLRREKRCGVPTTLQLLRPIAEALDAAHAAGVVHRDLKPQNIFLAWEPSGETVPKLLDFGMAKLLGDSAVHTVSGVPIGTPLYMSPEQARGEKVDGRSDVYALGVLCHEMLTGRVPFTGESPLAVLVSHLTVPPPRASEVCPELSPELDEPILHMLHKEPSGRPATAGAAIQELIKAAERIGHVIPTGMPHLPPPPSAPRTATVFSSLPPSPHPDDDDSVSSDNVEREAMLRRTDRAPGAQLDHKRSASWAFLGLLVALAAGALYLGRSAMNAPQPPGSAPSAPAPVASVAAAAAFTQPTPAPAAPIVLPSPAPPATVALSLRGAPRGARVSLGDTLLGEASEVLRLPLGKAPIELSVTAPGYEPQTLHVTPAQDTQAEVKLKRRAPNRLAPYPAIWRALFELGTAGPRGGRVMRGRVCVRATSGDRSRRMR